MTGPILTVFALYLFAVVLIVVGVFLIIGLGPAFITLGISSLVLAVITARGIFNV